MGPFLFQEEKTDAETDPPCKFAARRRNGARGVVVSRSLCMRKALGSSPRGSISLLLSYFEKKFKCVRNKIVYMFRGSIVVSISACHADDPGSIPGRGVIFLCWHRYMGA